MKLGDFLRDAAAWLVLLLLLLGMALLAALWILLSLLDW